MKSNPNADRLALLRFMNIRDLTETDLAAQMNWSRAHVHGICTDVKSDAFALSDAFKWRFGETFGLAVADLVFGAGRAPITDGKHATT